MSVVCDGANNKVYVGGSPVLGLQTVTALADSAATLTAALIIAALSSPVVGSYFDFTIVNNGASTLTVTTATGHTLSGLMTVPTTISATFRVLVTSGTTCTVYRM